METPHDMQNMPQTQLDTNMVKAKPVKLGWREEEIAQITSVLNDLLANYTVHYQKLRNFHWNVRGRDFFDLHDQFERLYNEAHKNIDKIAERIRVFGQTPLSTFHDYLQTAEIKETGTDLESDIMVREVLSDFRILLEYMFAAVQAANDQEDAGTTQMIKHFIFHIEKHHWMLTSFLAK